MSSVPLIVHVIDRLDVGGLENGLVNLINRMPPERYRHAVICLKSYSEFRSRLQRPDVPVFALRTASGRDPRMHVRLWRLLRELQPAIVHTRNLPTLECQPIAAAAGVGRRVHGEHGRDIYDLDGTRPRYRLLRRAVHPFVHQYVAVSQELERWLIDTVRARPVQVTRIGNGVDTERFHPNLDRQAVEEVHGFDRSRHVVIGTVGRLAAVKDQLTLVRAFVRLAGSDPDLGSSVRLAIAGDGSLRAACLDLLAAAGLQHAAWVPGRRDDIPAVMRSLDIFVLPSMAEGISNTILEAMATALPVVATDVGGTRELVDEGRTGMLVPAGDDQAMARAIRTYVQQPATRRAHGNAGRAAVASRSLERMVESYAAVYDDLLSGRASPIPFATGRAGPSRQRLSEGS